MSRRNILAAAYKDGILEHPLPHPVPCRAMQKAVKRTRNVPTPDDLRRPGWAPEAMAFHDSTRGRQKYDRMVGGEWHELARVIVPFGTVANIKRIDQYLKVDNLLITRAGATDTFGPQAQLFRWRLRLTQIDPRGVGPWLDGTIWSPVEDGLPGHGWSTHANSDELGFPWGADFEMNLIVPQGYILRYFVIVVRDLPLIPYEVAGKLIGFSQSAEHESTLWTTRRGW